MKIRQLQIIIRTAIITQIRYVRAFRNFSTFQALVKNAPIDYSVRARDYRFNFDTAKEAIRAGAADLVTFGVPFLTNPDLPERFRLNAPLNQPDPATFYTGGEQEYADYPSL